MHSHRVIATSKVAVPRLARWLALAVLGTAAAVSVVRPSHAQDSVESAPRIRTAAELQELVGPIALYADDLVAIVLPASTYPLQVVQAARLLEARAANSALEPDDNWDDSIVALLNYPEVVKTMNDDLDWTSSLGEAVLNQRAEVLDAIQQFRNRAYTSGNLRSDDRQVVSNASDGITIKPANPQVIYVPYYEPERVVVYQPAPVFNYYPYAYPVYYYPYPVGYAFNTGYFWGVTTAFVIGWHSHHVNVYHCGFAGHPYYGHSYHDAFYVRNDIHVNVNLNRSGGVWNPGTRRDGRPYVRTDDHYVRTPGSVRTPGVAPALREQGRAGGVSGARQGYRNGNGSTAANGGAPAPTGNTATDATGRTGGVVGNRGGAGSNAGTISRGGASGNRGSYRGGDAAGSATVAPQTNGAAPRDRVATSPRVGTGSTAGGTSGGTAAPGSRYSVPNRDGRAGGVSGVARLTPAPGTSNAYRGGSGQTQGQARPSIPTPPAATPPAARPSPEASRQAPRYDRGGGGGPQTFGRAPSSPRQDSRDAAPRAPAPAQRQDSDDSAARAPAPAPQQDSGDNGRSGGASSRGDGGGQYRGGASGNSTRQHGSR